MLGVDSEGQISVYVPMRGDVSLPWTPDRRSLGTASGIVKWRGQRSFGLHERFCLSVTEPVSARRASCGEEDSLPASPAGVEQPEGGASEVGIVYIRKP